jgi:hypothetical protein
MEFPGGERKKTPARLFAGRGMKVKLLYLTMRRKPAGIKDHYDRY